jgi:1-deoxy-D-xylulose-5-phosphate reductoisomerase
MKSVAVLGSTGSIGQNALRVLSGFADRFSVFGLSANRNVQLLKEQISRFKPEVAVVYDRDALRRLGPLSDVEILQGDQGLETLSSHPRVDLVINALVGSVGLLPSLRAVESGKTLAIANKESLVMAGRLLMQIARENGAQILPIDSEHSAIQQCLLAGQKEEIRRLVLTASGGPFLSKNPEDLGKVTVQEALSHPTWDMGKKITIDSATLMNKGLEVIEAHWLFGVPADRIQVLIHPQSIIHSMVEFVDGSVVAQMSVPDMKLPIQYALFYPQRIASPQDPNSDNNTRLDLSKIGRLTFLEPDFGKFPCLGLAYQALKLGGTAPAVLNAANETAVGAFLEQRIGFTHIEKVVRETLGQHKTESSPSLDDILKADHWARQTAAELCSESEITR